jgi:hypothetical protein
MARRRELLNLDDDDEEDEEEEEEEEVEEEVEEGTGSLNVLSHPHATCSIEGSDMNCLLDGVCT